MKVKSMLLVAMCLSSSLAWAQSNWEDYFNNPTWHECETEMSTAQVLSFDDEQRPVHYTHNVVYKASQGEALTLQILRPDRPIDRSTEQLLPCVIFIQGSAWMKQNVYTRLPILGDFAAKGYVVAMVEYTHSGLAPFPAPLQDVKAAIRYMRLHADKYGVDPDNMFIWGDSSGGHLAMMTAVTSGVEAFDTDLYGDQSTGINACVSYYGVSDIRAAHHDPCSASTGLGDSPEGLLIGGKAVDDYVEESAAASPITYVSKDNDIPPMMLVVGTCDHIVPFSQSEMMAKKLDEEGKEYVYYVIKGADHGSWEFWTPLMLDKVDAFFKQHMK